jgi:hypothetical protein
MKRTAFVFLFALVLTAQSARDGYRKAYSDWRQTDPSLERDAANTTQPLAPRISKAAQAAAHYKAARTSFLRDAAYSLSLSLAPLEAATPIDAGTFAGRLQGFTLAEIKSADATIKAFQNDKDPGIVRVRKALERERAALAALTEAENQTVAAMSKTSQTSAKLEESRKALLDSYARMDTALKEAAEDSDRESALWGDYYRKLNPATQALSGSSEQ